MTEADRLELKAGVELLLAIASLSDLERHAVMGRTMRGLTLAVLAAERGVTTKAISIQEHQGLAKLRARLDPDLYGIAA